MWIFLLLASFWPVSFFSAQSLGRRKWNEKITRHLRSRIILFFDWTPHLYVWMRHGLDYRVPLRLDSLISHMPLKFSHYFDEILCKNINRKRLFKTLQTFVKKIRFFFLSFFSLCISLFFVIRFWIRVVIIFSVYRLK